MLTALLGLAAAQTPLLDLLGDELERAGAVFGTRDEAPHYTAVALTDVERVDLLARSGTVAALRQADERYLDVDLRVGTPDLDSTHPMRGFSAMSGDRRGTVRVPPGPPTYALRHTLARALDARYRDAAERIVLLRANRSVLAAEDRPAPDFEPREGQTDVIEVAPLQLDVDAWTERLTRLSARIDRSAAVHQHGLRLLATREVTHFADTEGARLQHGRRHARLLVDLRTTADDGDEVRVFDAFDVHDPADLPTDGLDVWVDDQIARLEALRAAPRAEPYSGPVLLTGRAAGVFVHEVLGHRVEGHRQKREDEGRTFADHVGQPILPDFIDIVDDPTVAQAHGVDLNGHYRWDDEGVAAQPVTLVEEGVFQGFLMSRSPLPDVANSNGHGRRSPGNAPTARMGNTILTARQTQPEAQLRRWLQDELRAAGLPYGYIIEDIEGGFALTGRVMPNAFNIRAVASRRVYADERPDELVRGIDLVGTPFVAFANLVAAGEQPQVFNGTCGAESGWVPVSAVSPPLLFRRLEFQLKEKGQSRPPLLPPPPTDDDAAAEAP